MIEIDTGVIEGQPDLIYPAGTAGPAKLQCNTGSANTPYCGYDFVSCDQGNVTADSGSQSSACTQ